MSTSPSCPMCWSGNWRMASRTSTSSVRLGKAWGCRRPSAAPPPGVMPPAASPCTPARGRAGRPSPAPLRSPPPASASLDPSPQYPFYKSYTAGNPGAAQLRLWFSYGYGSARSRRMDYSSRGENSYEQSRRFEGTGNLQSGLQRVLRGDIRRSGTRDDRKVR